MFSVHTKMQRRVFQIPLVWRAVSKSSVFRFRLAWMVDLTIESCVFKFHRHSVNGAYYKNLLPGTQSRYLCYFFRELLQGSTALYHKNCMFFTDGASLSKFSSFKTLICTAWGLRFSCSHYNKCSCSLIIVANPHWKSRESYDWIIAFVKRNVPSSIIGSVVFGRFTRLGNLRQ